MKKKKTCAYGTVLFARENAEFFSSHPDVFHITIEISRNKSFLLYLYLYIIYVRESISKCTDIFYILGLFSSVKKNDENGQASAT